MSRTRKRTADRARPPAGVTTAELRRAAEAAGALVPSAMGELHRARKRRDPHAAAEARAKVSALEHEYRALLAAVREAEGRDGEAPPRR